jgi:hypothetical protein
MAQKEVLKKRGWQNEKYYGCDEDDGYWKNSDEGKYEVNSSAGKKIFTLFGDAIKYYESLDHSKVFWDRTEELKLITSFTEGSNYVG